LVAQLAGGGLVFGQNEKRDDIMPRLLSPGALGKRVVILDNLKADKFSSADFEQLVTLETLSGRKLYAGEGQRPNTLTYIITANDPALSKDMAQRSVPVRLKRPSFDPGWKAEVQDFIERHRWELVGDIRALLEGPKTPPTVPFRWGPWVAEVLGACNNPDACLHLIIARQKETDADAAEADQVRAEIVQELSRRGYDLKGEDVRFDPEVIQAAWVRATGRPSSTSVACRRVKALSIPGLQQKKTGKGSSWLLHLRHSPAGPHSTQGGEAQLQEGDGKEAA
jgi:hypothetical protein